MYVCMQAREAKGFSKAFITSHKGFTRNNKGFAIMV